ncbi:MAG: class I SAM-dependent methyltransferase [Brasilonema angustatum HA4187-MV1]|jgi:2-polyprenyl-3-methyl-5-hydroxy-6-metoxy-1,4-benzoquinol methylase|nr:class I SAM-dependent methyltransferase [Brasilonema angustatum HA4187-MV1]
MSYKSTTDRLFEQYNTYIQRPTIENSRSKKLIYQYFQRILNPWLPVDRSARILDVGCGEGALIAFLKEKGYTNLSGFDISPQNVAICHRLGFKFVQQLDVLQLKQDPRAERYDVIFAIDILEHLPKQAAAQFLEQIRKQLKPGGYVVVQTPNMGSVFGCLYRYADLSHEFGLTEHSAVSLLTIAGFAAEKVEIKPSWNASTFLGYLREAYLRVLHQVIFLAEGAGCPKIPTKNLLMRAFNS